MKSLAAFAMFHPAAFPDLFSVATQRPVPDRPRLHMTQKELERAKQRWRQKRKD